MRNILLFGDSNTWGFDYTTYDPALRSGLRLNETERWSAITGTLLGNGYHVIEEGLGGRTCVWDDPYLPQRNGRPALRMLLDAHAPLDLVAIHLGCNELKHWFGLSPEMIAFGVEQLVGECRVRQYSYEIPKVLIIAPPPVRPEVDRGVYGMMYGPLAYEKSLRLGECLRATAAYCGCEFLDCGPLGFELNDVDGIHYSRADHRRLAEAAAEKIREMLG